jgi:hypothetical protein
MKMQVFNLVILSLAITFSGPQAEAARKGGWSLGGGLGIVNSTQKDMDTVITGTSGSGASEFGNAWEFQAQIAYRFSGMMGLIFRPSWYMNSEEGSGGYEYSMNAWTFFPMLRFHLLESQTIKFYSQLGLGIGHVSAEIKEPTPFTAEFSGTQIGYMGGLGAEFCFIKDHCFFVEGNIRILSVDRMTVDKSSGTPANAALITQFGKGQEFEINGRDFSASLSGIQGFVGYNFYF